MRILLPCLLFVFVSCNQSASVNKTPAENKISTDSLLKAWNKAWNDRDSAAIIAQLTDDAVMLSASKTMNGKPEIANKFVSRFYKSMLNLQAKKVYESAAGDMAVQAGTYTHEIQNADSTKKNASDGGGYTFVWKQQADKSWKLRFLELE